MIKKMQGMYKSFDGIDTRTKTILILSLSIIILKVFLPKLSAQRRKKMRSELIDSITAYISEVKING